MNNQTIANIDNGQAYDQGSRKSNIWIYPLVSYLISAIVFLGYFLLKDSFGNSKIREFTEQFAKAVKSNDTSTIYRLYPDAKLAESFAFPDTVDDAKIKKKGDNWEVTFSDGKSLTIAKSTSGNSFYIKKSQGVFSYSPDKFNLATKTGWYDPKLNDKENAERLADTNFPDWLSKRSKQYLKNIVKITVATSSKGPDKASYEDNSSYGDTFCTVVVTNSGDYDMSGNEYVITAQEKWTEWSNWDTPDFNGRETTGKGSAKKLTGKPIPANGTATYTWKGEGFYGSAHAITDKFHLTASIAFTPQAEKAAKERVKYTGNEYSLYLAEKGK